MLENEKMFPANLVSSSMLTSYLFVNSDLVVLSRCFAGSLLVKLAIFRLKSQI